MTAKLLVFPKNMTIYHEGEVVGSVQSFTVVNVIVTIAIIILFIILWRNRNRNEVTRVATLTIPLIYVSTAFSFSPIVFAWAMADRYIYFGSIFFCYTLALLLISIQNKKKIGFYLFAIILILYSYRTFTRAADWTNNKALWTSTQKVAVYSYRVYNNLGDVAATEGNLDEAIKFFQISLQLNPKFADAVHNLGYIYYQKGDRELAKQYFVKSYEMNNYLFQSLYKLGVLAFEDQDYLLAQQYMAKTLEIAPTYEPARKAMVIIDQTIKSLPASSAPAGIGPVPSATGTSAPSASN